MDHLYIYIYTRVCVCVCVCMRVLKIPCFDYNILVFEYWLRQSCLCFTVLGKDSVLMELMCWLELVFSVHCVVSVIPFLEISSSSFKLLFHFYFSGGLLGENFIVRHILPLLKNVVRSCSDISYMSKPEPVQSWSSLALIDGLMTLDGLIAFLPREVVIKELIEVLYLIFIILIFI